MNAPMIVEPKPLDAPLIQEIADRIRARIRRTVADIIDNGQDLAQVKAALDHGEFGEWIDHEFGMTMRTAQNYIRAAAWAEGKNEIISHLPPRTLYLLSAKSTPEEIQAEFVSDLKAGKPVDVRMIKCRITDARLKEREAERAKQHNQKRSKAAKQRLAREIEKFKAERLGCERQQEQHINAVIPILRQLGHADLERLTELFAAIDGWRLREVPIRALKDKDEETDDDLTAIPAAFKRGSVRGGEA